MSVSIVSQAVRNIALEANVSTGLVLSVLQRGGVITLEQMESILSYFINNPPRKQTMKTPELLAELERHSISIADVIVSLENKGERLEGRGDSFDAALVEAVREAGERGWIAVAVSPRNTTP